MSLFRSLRRVLQGAALAPAAPPPADDPPRLTAWTQRAYDRLIEALGPAAANLSRHELQTLVWLAGWDVTDDMVNIFRKARQG